MPIELLSRVMEISYNVWQTWNFSRFSWRTFIYIARYITLLTMIINFDIYSTIRDGQKWRTKMCTPKIRSTFWPTHVLENIFERSISAALKVNYIIVGLSLSDESLLIVPFSNFQRYQNTARTCLHILLKRIGDLLDQFMMRFRLLTPSA